jgi:hypothetical protein
LLHYYYSFVRPVLEYACPVWHTSLTLDQCDRIELIQKRALSIIFSMPVYENYSEYCSANCIETLACRRDNLCQKCFNKCVMNENSCIHYLLPKLKDQTIANKLRNGP